MLGMTELGCLFVPVMMLVGFTLQAEINNGKEEEKTGNFMEDEHWLSTISQYSRKIKHWNRFRDDDYVRTWDENQGGSNENVDTTKDPCQKVKCSRNKVCIAQGYQRAVCVNRKKLEHRLKQPALRSPEGGCQPCPISSSGPVCGSDGHNYASQCKLEQQACLTGKELTMKCSGLCPCPTAAPTKEAEVKHESCTGQDLSDLGDRLRDWFQLLQGNAKLNNNSKTGASNTAGATSGSVLDRSVVVSCKDSVGWMFSKLDTNSDLYLDQAELAAINLDKYEVCIRPFFNSCDSYRDGKVSTAEWCLCFWRQKPPCLAELERIQVQEGGKNKLGLFIPSCNEDGYYRKLQCDQARGECWCVDQQGGELASSRIHGNPDCDEAVAYSGDFGSGVGWEDEEDKEAEENAEEEEGEVGEADDEGYIW
ncbi:testican-2-like isoform X1 [Salvelinus fontinalis]|uniref:testican-2-like isoform X1 n=1 Tax=Salvelinus fontinalis TaxID=8038 RepID=UPI0024858C71|nr:testican-2-like isoform X1 [Salvelinus fontinalis]